MLRRSTLKPVSLADEACELIEHCLRDFTSRPDLLNRHLSAGFLARSLALIRRIAALGDADLEDLCARLARVLLEACFAWALCPAVRTGPSRSPSSSSLRSPTIGTIGSTR